MQYLIDYKKYLKRWSVWATTALGILALATPIVERHPEFVAAWSALILVLGVIKQGEDGPLGRAGAKLKELLGAVIVLSVVVATVILQGCQPTRPPEAQDKRNECMSAAKAKADAQATKLCHIPFILCDEDDCSQHEWTNCDAREGIMEHMQREQEACR